MEIFGGDEKRYYLCNVHSRQPLNFKLSGVFYYTPFSPNTQRTYFDLCIIKYFLNIISPNNDMKAKIDALLANYPAIDTAAMGFPLGWENEPLWQ